MAVPGIGIGDLSLSRLGRGMFRGSGRMSVTFQFVPGWERNVVKETRPPARLLMPQIERSMEDAMSSMSRRQGGGGVEEQDDGWAIGIGQAGGVRTHWHLIEFGGGHHFARAPVRNALNRIGHFKEASK